MRIVSKLEIITVVTLLSLAFGNQLAFSKDNAINQLEDAQKNQESKSIINEINQTNTLLVSSKKLVQVNDSLIILPIPQPLGILCILGMAGVSGFLKLKIAKVKYEKQSEEKIEEISLTQKSA